MAENTYIVYDCSYKACTSMFIRFTCLVIKFCKSGNNVGQVIHTVYSNQFMNIIISNEYNTKNRKEN